MQSGEEFIKMISAKGYVPDESFYRRIFAQRLNDLRREHQISQRELAEKAGVSESFISDCERAIRTPKFKQLYALTKFWGISIDDLVGHTLEKSRDVIRYRFDRALSFVELSGNAFDFLDVDGCALIILADKKNRDINARDNLFIEFESSTAFTEFVETIVERAIAQGISFDESAHKIMDWWNSEGKQKFAADKNNRT